MKNGMNVIYMGTPAFAVPSLDALAAYHNVLAVCTQPDRPAGRGHKLAQSPVKTRALELGLPVLQPHTLRLDESKEFRAVLKSYGADIFVVAAYGMLLPKGVLVMPKVGCINVHASLLPKYRGASPIHAALLNGETKTGITIMHMAAGIDTGDMIVQRELDILPDERFTSLHDRMATLGADALLDALVLLQSGNAPRVVQDDALSSYAPMINKKDAQIDWSHNTEQVINMMRAFDPWPGAYTVYDGKPLKVWSAVAGEASAADPGTILAVDMSRGILVKTGDAAVWITELQGDGSKRMPATDYMRGREVRAGVRLV